MSTIDADTALTVITVRMNSIAMCRLTACFVACDTSTAT